MTHDSDARPASGNERSRLGKATLTTVWSTNAMNMPSDAIPTTVAGLTSRRRTAGAAALAARESCVAGGASASRGAESFSDKGRLTRRGCPPYVRLAGGESNYRPRRAMRHARLTPSLADFVTAANAVCGFLAIAVVARAWTGGATPDGRLPDADLVAAATLIIAGAALDSVDGIVARRRGGSPLGEHLEVMSDVVTFGVAPAVLFAVDASAYGAPWSGLALIVGGAYLVAALLRLARYIVLSSAAAGHELTGFPAPPAAMAMVAIVGLHGPGPLALATVLCVAALMIASFEFPVLTGAVGRFMIGWFVFGFLAIFTLPLWVPAAVTLAILICVLVAIARPGRPGGTSSADRARAPGLIHAGDE